MHTLGGASISAVTGSRGQSSIRVSAGYISLAEAAGMAGMVKYALPGASCYMLRGDGLERQAPQERARGVKNHIEPLRRHYGFPDGLHLHGVMIALFLVVNAQ